MRELIALISRGPKDNHTEWFNEIAKLLFSKFLIKTHANEYRLKQMEFYYYSEQHPDETTYGFVKHDKKYSDRIMRHKKAQCQPLTWFFHYSGMDLVIGKVNEPGGILIRAIENNVTKEIITGPLVVLLELLNQQISINGNKTLTLELIEREEEVECEMAVNKRLGLGEGIYNCAAYNYSAK